MSCFLYFAKDTTKLPAQLRYAFESEPAVNVITGKGIGGNHGAIFCVDAGKGRYNEQAQTWIDIPGTTLKLGWYTDDSPTPESLARKKQIDGHLVELGDGNKWLCPAARRYVKEGAELRWTISLPQVFSLNDDGQWVMGQVRQQFMELEKIASTYWDHRYGDKRGQVMNDEQFIKSAVSVLSHNYRVSEIEVSALELFDETTVKPIMDSLIDEQTLIRHFQEQSDDEDEKKNEDSALGS